MGRRLIAPLALLLALAGTAPANAALEWRPEQTVDMVRGVPNPDVALGPDGRAALVYSSTGGSGKPGISLWIRRPGQPEPFVGGLATPPAGATDPRVAMSPSGVTAVAALASGRLFVTVYPAFSRAPYSGKVVEIDAPGPVDEPWIDIDAAGRTTVVWASPPRRQWTSGPDPLRRNYAVTVGPDGVAGPVQELGGDTCDPSLDVNLRGDAVVALDCVDPADDYAYYRPAGGVFGSLERPFGDAGGWIQVGIDGSGTVHALGTSPVFEGKYSDTVDYRLAYASKSPGGSFTTPEEVRGPDGAVPYPPDLEVQENGRVIVGWATDDRWVYAVRTSGDSFGVTSTAPMAGTATREPRPPASLDVVASPNGPFLLTWGLHGERSGVSARLVGAGGVFEDPFQGVEGPITFGTPVPAFAINDSGQVVGAWEQVCGPRGALAVMAVQRDVGGTPKEPPCQDRRAPRIIVPHKRARERGRKLRVRVACDEACYFTASARVLRRGRRKPIASAKTLRERRLAARRGGWLTLPISRSESKRVARARRAGSRVTVRLGISVRDRYGTGRKWRFRVPLR